MSEINFKALADFFPADAIEWRIQSCGESQGRVWAIAVPYVTNRAIQQRLDDVAGPENWRNEFQAGPAGGVICGISLRVTGEWVTKWDGAENTKGMEGGEVKGGLSAAMKRAAVQWGIGRYLYGLDQTFAQVNENGRFRGRTKDQKAFRWDPPRLPAHVLPPPAGGGVRAHMNGNGHPAVDSELARLVDFIRHVGPQVDEAAEIRIQRKVRNLRIYVRENWPIIREQPGIARTVAEAIEAATGTSMESFFATGGV